MCAYISPGIMNKYIITFEANNRHELVGAVKAGKWVSIKGYNYFPKNINKYILDNIHVHNGITSTVGETKDSIIVYIDLSYNIHNALVSIPVLKNTHKKLLKQVKLKKYINKLK